ncbi:hypothetical protein C2I18_15860 [Paenibacillus sp. PK3_47]|uniref:hypothetical protein n=1 Tax=Paenibacillus sp. PK3_47 TaxID=2072642 RepID=UPI00201E33A7|nr:hypothetical protein [Paenibacillus sp. PK3_47]UQZ34878.1 hypothetical protein C2I18_15860 [Paenibacillus sp. PK3_47]
MSKKLLLVGSIALSLVFINGCSQETPANEPPHINSAAGNAVTANPDSSSTNQEAVNKAIEAAEAYKNKEYTVEAAGDVLSDEAIQTRNEELKPFFTDDFYAKAVDTRYTALPLTAVHEHKLSLQPDNLVFTLVNDKKEIIELRYNADLVLTDQEDKESSRVPVEGILTLKEVNGAWLIQGDRFDSAAFNQLINK